MALAEAVKRFCVASLALPITHPSQVGMLAPVLSMAAGTRDWIFRRRFPDGCFWCDTSGYRVQFVGRNVVRPLRKRLAKLVAVTTQPTVGESSKIPYFLETFTVHG